MSKKGKNENKGREKKKTKSGKKGRKEINKTEIKVDSSRGNLYLHVVARRRT